MVIRFRQDNSFSLPLFLFFSLGFFLCFSRCSVCSTEYGIIISGWSPLDLLTAVSGPVVVVLVVVEVEVEVQGTQPGVRDGHVPALGLWAAEIPTGPFLGWRHTQWPIYIVYCVYLYAKKDIFINLYK